MAIVICVTWWCLVTQYRLCDSISTFGCVMDEIAPPLHDFSSLIQILGVVVYISDRIFINMCQRQLDSVSIKPLFV